MAADLPRGTVTLLFSDIEGSTELSRRHGAAYGDLRAEHRGLLRAALEAHRGHEVDTEGDAFFAVFERATDAVAAAVAAQRELAAINAVRVRMGLHTAGADPPTDVRQILQVPRTRWDGLGRAERGSLCLPSGPGNGDTMGFRFALVSTAGDVFDSFETNEVNWTTGDVVIAHRNRHYRVVSVIPAELAAEFVDGPLYGVLEVEPV